MRDDSLRLDSNAVKVLAHPLRSRLLSELRIHGPATATELARTLATNTGATSYHLRALEGVGLVKDTEDGVGKRRVWQAATASHAWADSDFTDDADAAVALGWLRRHYLRQFVERADAWEDGKSHWPAAWQDALGMGDAFVEVTAEQALDMRREFDAILEKYRAIGAGDPRAVRAIVTIHAAPLDGVPDA